MLLDGLFKQSKHAKAIVLSKPILRKQVLTALALAVLLFTLVTSLAPLIRAAHATTFTFGYTTVGATEYTTGSNNQGGFIMGYHAAPTSSGTVSKISAYVYAYSGYDTAVQLSFALYTYLGPGDPGSLIANTSVATFGTTAEWNNISFSSPPSVTAGTQYWICWYQNDTTHYNYDSGGASGIGFWSNGYTSQFPNWPSSITTGVTSSSAQRSIFAMVNTVPLSVSISPSSTSFNVGGSQYFTSSATGGTPPYTYQWVLNGAAVSGATKPNWTFTPTAAGSYNVYCNVTDSASAKAESNTATATVSKVAGLSGSMVFNNTFQSGTELTTNSPPGAWTGSYLPDGATGGSNTIESSVAYPGDTYAANFTATTYQQYGCVYKNLTTSYTYMTTSVECMFTRWPAKSVFGPTMCVDYDHGTFFRVEQNVSGSVYWGIEVCEDSGFQDFYETTPSNPQPYTWYNVTLYGKTGTSGTAAAELWVNGVPKVILTGMTITNRAPIWSIRNEFWLDQSESTPISFYSDNIIAFENQTAATWPPLVSIAPSGTVHMDVGQSETFTPTVVNGSSPFTYAWYLDGSSAGTGTTYTYTPASSGTHSIYLNVTDNQSRRAKSNTVSVVVSAQVSVSISPSSSSIDIGQSQAFTSSAGGGYGSYSYQWYLNGSGISGAQSASYTFTPSSRGHYNFYLNITDSNSERVESNTATVLVYVTISVSIAPTTATLDIGQQQTFASTVSGGSGGYSYEWYVNGSATGTSSSYLFTPSSRGRYNIYLNVTDSNSFRVESNTAVAAVNVTVSVSISPSSASLDVGQSQLFSSTVSGGSGSYTYQWYLNGSAIGSATGSTYLFTPASRGHYNFCLNATDTHGQRVESNTAAAVVYTAVSVSISPSLVNLELGQSQTFSSTVSGGLASYSYQWCLNGSAIGSAMSASYLFSPSSRGHYNFYLNVTDANNERVESNTVAAIVYLQVSVNISPSSESLDIGMQQVFSSIVSGGYGSYSYKWYLNGSVINGQTSSSYTFTASARGHYNFYLNVTDSLYFGVSNTAAILVNSLPSVTISPTSSSIQIGQSQTFTSTVSNGTSPFTYQWYLNGSAVGLATLSSWQFTPGSLGLYNVKVKVTDSLSKAVNSTVSTLTVTPVVLTVTIGPTTATLTIGEPLAFNCTVSGGSAYSYQWILNGTAVSGATNNTYTFTPSTSGYYTVYLNVTGNGGAKAKSNVAGVTVASGTLGAPFFAVTVVMVAVSSVYYWFYRRAHKTMSIAVSGIMMRLNPWSLFKLFKDFGQALTMF